MGYEVGNWSNQHEFRSEAPTQAPLQSLEKVHRVQERSKGWPANLRLCEASWVCVFFKTSSSATGMNVVDSPTEELGIASQCIFFTWRSCVPQVLCSCAHMIRCSHMTCHGMRNAHFLLGLALVGVDDSSLFNVQYYVLFVYQNVRSCMRRNK